MNLRSVFLAGLALAMVPFSALAAPLPDLGGKKVAVVTENAYPPLQFVDPKTGKPVGWEYDAMNEIAKRLNFKVEYLNTSWDAMIQAVADNQYQIGMTGITINDERKQKVDFSEPYMRSEQFMLVRADEKRFSDAKTFGEIKDGLVGAQPGTTNFYVAVYNLLDGNEQNPRIKLFETFGATIQALKTGDVDVVLTDSTAGKGYVDASGGALKLVGGPLGAEDFGFIFAKGSDLVGPVNAAIEVLKADARSTPSTKSGSSTTSSASRRPVVSSLTEQKSFRQEGLPLVVGRCRGHRCCARHSHPGQRYLRAGVLHGLARHLDHRLGLAPGIPARIGARPSARADEPLGTYRPAADRPVLRRNRSRNSSAGSPVLHRLCWCAGSCRPVEFPHPSASERRPVRALARLRDFSLLWRAIIALTLAYAAFLAEIFRAGIQAVDAGQIEAAKHSG